MAEEREDGFEFEIESNLLEDTTTTAMKMTLLGDVERSPREITSLDETVLDIDQFFLMGEGEDGPPEDK